MNKSFFIKLIDRIVLHRDNEISIQISQRRENNEAKEILNELSKLNQEYLKFFPWLGVLAPECPISVEIMASLCQISHRSSYEVMEDFAKNLLISKLSDSLGIYSISESAHTLARKVWNKIDSFNEIDLLTSPSDSISYLHDHLLKVYFQSSPKALWHCIPNDEYFYSNFLWHLEMSGRDDILHSLLQEVDDSGKNAWFSTCSRLGRIDLFLKALESAQSSAKQLIYESPSRAISLQCHYALMNAVVIQQIENIPVHWFGALLRTKLWTPDQVLFHIQVLREPQQRATAIKASIHHFPISHVQPLLSLIGEIKSDSAKASALQAIVPYLTQSQMDEAFDCICDISNEFYKSLAFNAFIPFCPEFMVGEVLQRVLMIKAEFARVQVLKKWIPTLPSNLLKKAHASSINIKDTGEKLNILILLTSRGLKLQAEIEQNLSQLSNPIEEAKYRLRIAQYVLKDSDKILKILSSLCNSSDLAYAINHLAIHLPSSMCDEVWDIAINIINEIDRVIAIIALFRRWPNVIAPRISDFIMQLQEIDSIQLVMDSAVKLLSKEDLLEIIRLASLSMNSHSLSILWLSISKEYPEFLQKSINIASQIENIEVRVEILIGILPICNNLQSEITNLILDIEDENVKAFRISQIAQYLDQKNLLKALKTSLSMNSKSAQEIAFQGLSEFLPQNELSWGIKMIDSNSILCLSLRNLRKQLMAYALEADVNDFKTSEIDFKKLALCSKASSKIDMNESVSLSFLQEVLKIKEPFQRARVLKGILHELETVDITESLWNSILESLIFDHGIDFINSFSSLIPIILNLSGISTLNKIAKSCSQISQQLCFSTQNIHDTFDIDLIPESLA